MTAVLVHRSGRTAFPAAGPVASAAVIARPLVGRIQPVVMVFFRAPSGLIAPFDFPRPSLAAPLVWVLLAWAVFGEIASPPAWIGGTIILVAAMARPPAGAVAIKED